MLSRSTRRTKVVNTLLLPRPFWPRTRQARKVCHRTDFPAAQVSLAVRPLRRRSLRKRLWT